jgi:very-short-patch-repair endonuclease
MTKAETCPWKFALRANQLKGYPFRRQRPVLNYIADFMCKDLMLIIEVDGITHQDEKSLMDTGYRRG